VLNRRDRTFVCIPQFTRRWFTDESVGPSLNDWRVDKGHYVAQAVQTGPRCWTWRWVCVTTCYPACADMHACYWTRKSKQTGV